MIIQIFSWAIVRVFGTGIIQLFFQFVSNLLISLHRWSIEGLQEIKCHWDILNITSMWHAQSIALFPGWPSRNIYKVRIILGRPATTSGTLNASSIIWARVATNNGRLLITYLYTSKTVQHAYVWIISITVKIVQGRRHSVLSDVFVFFLDHCSK